MDTYEIKFNSLLNDVKAKTVKSHVASIQKVEQLLRTFIEGQRSSRPLNPGIQDTLQDQAKKIANHNLNSVRQLYEPQDISDGDLLYQILKDSADQLVSVRLMLETFTSLGQINIERESWCQVLQIEAYRQLVSVERVKLSLEFFISQGKDVNFGNSPFARLKAANLQLVSVSKLTPMLDSLMQRGRQIKIVDFEAQQEAANLLLVSVNRVQQLLETFISQETLINEYSWNQVLKEEFKESYFIELSKYVSEERLNHTVYPPADLVFTWTKFCRVHDVKVVILGQDPYPGSNEAHGLSFSVPYGLDPPNSLKNIFKTLKKNGFKPPGHFKSKVCEEDNIKNVWEGHGTLIGWAVQGVLLLNSVLTVRAGNRKSHAGIGWEKITDAVISWLSNNLSGIVFMLWGVEAREKAALINRLKHTILESSHPSQQGPYQSSSEYESFLQCTHFSDCNNYLRQKGKTPIDWSWLPAIEPYRCKVDLYTM